MIDFRDAIVGIYYKDQDVCAFSGTGFLVEGNFILTSAHVLRDAQKSGKKIRFRYEINGEDCLAAELATDTVNDWSILKPDQIPVAAARLQFMRTSRSLENRRVTTAGYSLTNHPPHNPMQLIQAEGIVKYWHDQSGEISPNNLLQIESNNINKGFSGAPLWDLKSQQVTGMVNSGPKKTNNNPDVIFGTPIYSLYKRHRDLFAVSNDGDNGIYFANRLKELDHIENILLNKTQRYHFILSAPEGYGKTWFLKKLKRNITKKKRPLLVYSIDIKSSNEASDIPKLIYTEFFSKTAEEATNFTGELAAAIIKQWKCNSGQQPITTEKREKARPVIFLIDMAGDIDIKKSQEVLDAVRLFGRDLASRLKNCHRYDGAKLYFRVIIAGRYLSAIANPYEDGEIFYLSPFDYDAVFDAVSLASKFSHERLSEITDHLLFQAGGHPQLIMDLLSEYIESAEKAVKSSDELREYFIGLSNRIINKFAQDITATLPTYYDECTPQVQESLLYFRYISYPALQRLCNRHKCPALITCRKKLDKLTQVKLYQNTTDDPLFFSLLTRQVIIKHKIHRDIFDRKTVQNYAKQAMNICKDMIQLDRRKSEIWLFEYFYQILQLKSFEILFANKDNQLKQTEAEIIKDELTSLFYDGLKLYWSNTEDLYILEEERKTLDAELIKSRQWELLFLIRYLFGIKQEKGKENQVIDFMRKLFSQTYIEKHTNLTSLQASQ